MPKLSSLVLGSEAYALPPGAEQKGASSLLDSGDDRMQQVQFSGGAVWGSTPAVDRADGLLYVGPGTTTPPRPASAPPLARPAAHHPRPVIMTIPCSP